jgi:hypothetical protein
MRQALKKHNKQNAAPGSTQIQYSTMRNKKKIQIFLIVPTQWRMVFFLVILFSKDKKLMK